MPVCLSYYLPAHDDIPLEWIYPNATGFANSRKKKRKIIPRKASILFRYREEEEEEEKHV
jgi:hypothetical protein